MVLLEDRLPLVIRIVEVDGLVTCDNLFAFIAHTPFLPKDRMKSI